MDRNAARYPAEMARRRAVNWERLGESPAADNLSIQRMRLDAETYRRRIKFKIDELVDELQRETYRATPAERTAWRASLPNLRGGVPCAAAASARCGIAENAREVSIHQFSSGLARSAYPVTARRVSASRSHVGDCFYYERAWGDVHTSVRGAGRHGLRLLRDARHGEAVPRADDLKFFRADRASTGDSR